MLLLINIGDTHDEDAGADDDGDVELISYSVSHCSHQCLCYWHSHWRLLRRVFMHYERLRSLFMFNVPAISMLQCYRESLEVPQTLT